MGTITVERDSLKIATIAFANRRRIRLPPKRFQSFTMRSSNFPTTRQFRW